jgi:hypothetical protein
MMNPPPLNSTTKIFLQNLFFFSWSPTQHRFQQLPLKTKTFCLFLSSPPPSDNQQKRNPKTPYKKES